MKKLSIKSIIEFKGKSERGKKKIATALKIDKANVDIEGGGDYWVSCLSAISNSYKSNNLRYINERRHELEEKYGETENKRVQTMYKRNIDILYNYEDFDLKKWGSSKKK